MSEPIPNRREIRLNERVTRGFALGGSRVNKEKRTAHLSFASEEPIERFYRGEIVYEVISMDDFDVSRIDGAGALLLNHDPDQQIGGILRSWTAHDGARKVARAEVKFSRSQAGTDAFNDVEDGLRGSTSVGYELLAEVGREETDDGTPVVKFAARALEVSLVSVPADKTVGVGRGRSKIQVMTNEDKSKTIEAATNAGIGKERERICEIDAVRAHFKQYRGIPALCDEAKAEGWSVARLNNQALELIGNRPVEVRDFGVTVPQSEHREYSLVKAILSAAGGQLTGYEGECSQEITKRTGQSPRGFWFPMQTRMAGGGYSQRDLTAGGVGTGAETVPTMIPHELIDILRNRSTVIEAGARVMNGLSGDVAIPRKTATATTEWKTETGAITESTPTLDNLNLSPKRVGAYVEYSKQWLIQSAIDAEGFVRTDIADAIAVTIDAAALDGTGASNQPTGIVATSGVGSVTFGAAATWAKVLEFQTDLEAANALKGMPAYVSSAATKSKWRQILKESGDAGAHYLMEMDGSVAGYPFYATEQITSTSNIVVFGDFTALIVAFFGGGAIDIVVDGLSKAEQGLLRIIGTSYIDVGVRTAASFSVSSDSGAQ